jgi:hypothetical protein
MKAIGFEELDDAGAHGKESKTSKSVGDLKGKNKIFLHAMYGKKLHVIPNDVENSLKAKKYEIEQEIIALDGAPSVSAAVREMRIHHTLTEVKGAVETALTIIRNLLDRPNDPKLYRIKRGNISFHKSVGRLENGLLLMRSIGFVASTKENGDIGPGILLLT